MKTIITILCIVISTMTLAQVGISPSNDFRPNIINSGGPIRNQDTDTNDAVIPPMLDVDGKVRVRAMPVAESNSSFSSVVRDNNTGVLKVLSELNEANKPINITTYKIKNMDQDWVEDFNTLIPADSWTMAVIGWRFRNAEGAGDAILIANRNAIQDNIPNGADQQFFVANKEKFDFFTSPNVFASRSGGTWRLNADFMGAGTNMNYLGQEHLVFGNGYWEIDVLIIDNSLVNVLNSPATSNLGGHSDNGSATSNVLD